jgi:glutamyl-Q tRNA(Asp) synthetase
VTYVGRFAPSPTGPLHIGSLTTAVASFLHARQSSGEWLVRIEDIDPPREAPGAVDGILRTLEAFELPWDRAVEYQSRRLAAYSATVGALLANGAAFRCVCSRSAVRAANADDGARYPGTCRAKAVSGKRTAVRVRVDPGALSFVDGLQGAIEAELSATTGDYVIWRRDGLPAYHLAVVLDDAEQGVTTVVRGVDLLESTAAHLHLQRVLGLPAPRYFHTPVIVNPLRQKLSKQTGAAPVEGNAAAATARRVLGLLGLAVPRALAGARPSELWSWAIAHWRIEALAGARELAEP